MEEVEDKTDLEEQNHQEKTNPESDAKSLNSEIELLKNELENERKKTTDQANRMKYLQADIINLQRRSDQMVSEARSEVKLIWILEMVSVLEDLRRALKVASQEESPSLVDGLKLVIARIENTLKSEHVESIKAEPGTKFDPKFHEAVSYRETTEDEGKILSVIGYGCLVGGKVVKPALVEVGRRKPAETSRSVKQNQIEQELKVESSNETAQ